MHFASIGSVTAGTLRPQDLASAYHHALLQLARRDGENPERKARTEAALADIQGALGSDEPEDLDELETFVNEQAPELFEAYCAPFTRFGAHPGDGADIGVWPDIDSLMEAARYEDGVLRVDAGDEWPELDEGIDHVVEVNDHGNVTLYDARTRAELWSCV